MSIRKTRQTPKTQTVVVYVGTPIKGVPNGMNINKTATQKLIDMLNEFDKTGKTVFDHISENITGEGFIVTLPRNHPCLVELIRDGKIDAGVKDSFLTVINIPEGKFTVNRTSNIHFICDPLIGEQL
jgi:hypothetical protein